MNEKIENIMESTLENIVKDAILKVNIEEIMIKQVEKVVEQIASDMFSNWGPFKDSLEKKFRKDIDINIDKITVPEFGNLAAHLIEAEFAKVERQEEKRLGKLITKRIAELTRTDNDPIKLLEIQNVFYVVMFDEFIKHTLDCSCEIDFNPDDRDNIIDYMEEIKEYNSDFDYELTFIEKSMNWGSDWKACHTNLHICFKRKEKIVYELIVKIDRVRQEGETYNDDDYWRSGADNFYKVTDVFVNGKSINSDGSIYLNGLDYELEEKFAGMFLNGALLDCNNLANFEHDVD